MRIKSAEEESMGNCQFHICRLTMPSSFIPQQTLRQKGVIQSLCITEKCVNQLNRPLRSCQMDLYILLEVIIWFCQVGGLLGSSKC